MIGNNLVHVRDGTLSLGGRRGCLGCWSEMVLLCVCVVRGGGNESLIMNLFFLFSLSTDQGSIATVKGYLGWMKRETLHV